MIWILLRFVLGVLFGFGFCVVYLLSTPTKLSADQRTVKLIAGFAVLLSFEIIVFRMCWYEFMIGSGLALYLLVEQAIRK